MSDKPSATSDEQGAMILAANEVFVCRASGEGSHDFRVCADEAAVLAFYDEMFGKEADGTLDLTIKHLRDEDNWSNASTAYHCELYCATFEVWKVDREQVAAPTSAASESALTMPHPNANEIREAIRNVAIEECWRAAHSVLEGDGHVLDACDKIRALKNAAPQVESASPNVPIAQKGRARQQGRGSEVAPPGQPQVDEVAGSIPARDSISSAASAGGVATPRTDECESVNANRVGSSAERYSVYDLARQLERETIAWGAAVFKACGNRHASTPEEVEATVAEHVKHHVASSAASSAALRIMVWKDGSYNCLTDEEAEGLKADPDLFVSIPLVHGVAPSVQPAAALTAEPVAWANWKVGTNSYIPKRTREEAEKSAEVSRISATQEGTYEVVPLYARSATARTTEQEFRYKFLDRAALEAFMVSEGWLRPIPVVTTRPDSRSRP